MTLKHTLFIVLMSCLFSQDLLGQIVNIEDKRTQLDTNKWQGQLDVKSKLTRNTKSIFSLSSTIRVDRSGVDDNWLLLASYNFVQAGEENFIDDGFVHLRFDKTIKSQWQWEVFSQVQYNQRLRIKLRTLLGTGPRLELIENEKTKIAMGLLYMYEYNELDADIGVRRNHRLSSYLTIRIKPSDNIAFSSTSYYQPILTNFGESRLSTINTLTMKINRFLSFTSSFSLTYDAQLAQDIEGVPLATYQWQNGARFVF